MPAFWRRCRKCDTVLVLAVSNELAVCVDCQMKAYRTEIQNGHIRHRRQGLRRSLLKNQIRKEK